MTSVSGFWIKTSEKSRGVGFNGRRFDVKSDLQIISENFERRGVTKTGLTSALQ